MRQEDWEFESSLSYIAGDSGKEGNRKGERGRGWNEKEMERGGKKGRKEGRKKGRKQGRDKGGNQPSV